jgi:DNA mismatch endonuclease (patch repair protein)
MDTVDQKTRSRMMAGIRGKNTKPEISVRRYLHAHGFRFRLHVGNLPGRPDIVLPKYKLCIFVHGCFWHQHQDCRFATIPKTRQDFWLAKFAANRTRDERVRRNLIEAGWRVLVIWECMLKSHDATPLDWLPGYITQDVERGR